MRQQQFRIYMMIPIEDLNIGVGAYNSLKVAGLHRVWQLEDLAPSAWEKIAGTKRRREIFRELAGLKKAMGV